MDETATQRLHRVTSYRQTPDSWDAPAGDPLVVRFETNDLTRLPWFYKRYRDPLPEVRLPDALPSTAAPAVAVLAGTAGVPSRPLDLAHLGRLLHLSAGVVRTQERPYGTYLFRAAGSAGARFPLEVYVAIPEGASLPAGVHWYHPEAHALVRVGPPPEGEAPTVVVTGVPWRTGWRYRERGYRHVYWDAGTLLAHVLALAESAGVSPRVYTRFPDEEVAALVGADGVHEWPVVAVALGAGGPALIPTAPGIAGGVDADPVELPLVTLAQRAGDRDALGSPWPTGDAVDAPVDRGGPVEEVVLARGSQRRMDASRGLAEEVLRISVGVALRGIEVPHRIVVHDVDGFEPGLYRWPELTTPARPGPFRDELFRLCLDQDLGRDASFVVIGAADVSALDDRAYREAQLAAGLVEGRLHLLAYALGASATGMTFVDAELPRFLGEPLDGLLFTCVGVPEYRSARGGGPRAPARVRRVEPRVS